ncbi:MAG: hypothetical protein HC883_01960 [Bdellovibrionaceae bacterium]|nr:hypothetical protein [Pseudobdellovibrionaceae bacterium]
MKNRFRIPIAVKLISVTVILLAITTGVIAQRSAADFARLSIERQQDANLDQSKARAAEVEGLLMSYIDKAKVVASLLLKDYSAPEEKAKALDLTFGRDKDLVAVDVISRSESETPRRVVNETYLLQYKLDKSFIEVLRSAQVARRLVHREALFNGKEGHVEVRNSTIEGGAPLLTVGFPLARRIRHSHAYCGGGISAGPVAENFRGDQSRKFVPGR